MENKRAQTLEALSAFIQTQRALLSRTQSDIEKLRDLKNEAAARPSDFASNLSQELDDGAFKLSEAVDYKLEVPENIDWSIFAGCDSTAFRTLSLSTRLEYSQRNEPHANQRSELSPLQKFVKSARQTIVDPVLAEFALLSDPEDESEEEVDLEKLKKERERQKIHELKKRKIQSCGLTVPFRARGPSGVFIRRDVEDESADVDISLDGDNTNIVAMDVDKPLALIPRPIIPMALTKTARTRHPSTKLQNQDSPVSNRKPKTAKNTKAVKREPDPEPPPQPTKAKPAKRSRDSNKPKPETYKLAWSVSEQNLLEQLLDEIPDGERNRWAKISQAMNGKRTPRQVASRVQKYFEKLKRFGIGVDARGGID